MPWPWPWPWPRCNGCGWPPGHVATVADVNCLLQGPMGAPHQTEKFVMAIFGARESCRTTRPMPLETIRKAVSRTPCVTRCIIGYGKDAIHFVLATCIFLEGWVKPFSLFLCFVFSIPGKSDYWGPWGPLAVLSWRFRNLQRKCFRLLGRKVRGTPGAR